MNEEWNRGYYCAVAALLLEAGCVTPEVRSLYEQGGHPEHADAEDAALFSRHGLKTPNVRLEPDTTDGKDDDESH